MTTTENQPRIYVGTYAKYNNDSIEGQWLDLSDYTSKEEFYEACAELHKDESDPEFMFQDWVNVPEGMMGESWIADNLFELFDALNDMDAERQEAFNLFCENNSHDLHKSDISDLIEQFDESYMGHFANGLEDYAYDLVQDCYFTSETPDIFKTYFDYTSFARDLSFDGYWENDGHVFRSI